MAMATYPHIQKRAQVEIDRVTNGQRLPDFNDFESLPFIQALVRETVRWRPVFLDALRRRAFLRCSALGQLAGNEVGHTISFITKPILTIISASPVTLLPTQLHALPQLVPAVASTAVPLKRKSKMDASLSLSHA